MVNTRAFVECKNITVKVTFRTICVSTVNIVFVKKILKRSEIDILIVHDNKLEMPLRVCFIQRDILHFDTI